MFSMPAVRLFEYSVEKEAVEVESELGIIEVQRPDGQIGRYLRTDGFDASGRRLYGLLGTVTSMSEGCPTCRDPWDVYTHRLGDELATDFERHTSLFQCGDCGSLLEVFPEGRESPVRLSVDEARRAFPGAL
jgi:hypothetical protein